MRQYNLIVINIISLIAYRSEDGARGASDKVGKEDLAASLGIFLIDR